MTNPPSPLTPSDCDLRDFSFMPLDVVRLRDSDIAAISSGDEFRCAVLLWCASWHQIPAASLPDDDIVLSQLAGFGRVVKEWKKVREGALRNWIKCSDGRLYHPVVAEKANEAWQGRVKYCEKKEAERLRKAEERRLKKLAEEGGQAPERPTDNGDLSGGQAANVQGTSQGNPAENALTVDSGQKTEDSRKEKTYTAAGASKKYSMRADLLDRGIAGQIVDDWLECRKKKKLANTLTALEGILDEADKAGLSLEDALTICCKQGWGGFKASWLQNDPSLVGDEKPWER